VHDWELEFFISFFDQLYSIRLKQDRVDKLCLNSPKRQLFDVRTLYNVLIPHDNTPIPWRCIWESKAPLRVAFFTWSALLGKILTLDNQESGGQFTWSNNRVWSKIDRFLLSPEWEEHYPDVSQRRLPRLLSDRSPLLLDCGTHREEKKKKDILNLKTCGSNPMVLWNKCNGGGSLMISMAC